MAKYKVECGALVTRLMRRTLLVYANSEEEAIEKAKERFDEEVGKLKTYTEPCPTINIDSIERLR